MKKKNNRFIKRFVGVLVLLLIISIIVINFISNYFSVRVTEYGKQEAVRKGSEAIASVISDNVLSYLDLEKMLVYSNSSEEVSQVTINTVELNKIIKDVNNTLVNKTDQLSIEKIVLPYRILLSEILFSNSDKGIEISIKPVGSYNVDITTQTQEYGINNTLLTIDLLIKVNIQILIPFNSEEIEVIAKVPLIMQIIQGKVPLGVFYKS